MGSLSVYILNRNHKNLFLKSDPKLIYIHTFPLEIIYIVDIKKHGLVSMVRNRGFKSVVQLMVLTFGKQYTKHSVG